ncbi:MAG: CotH kinase family protein [Myxococcales bacterium]|nr:CotH kinase family protein [Myxococcales bacterium]
MGRARCLLPLLCGALACGGPSAVPEEELPPGSEQAFPAGQPRRPVEPSLPPLLPGSGLCQPTGGGALWLIELEPLSVKLSCATGYQAPGLAFTASPLPKGARLDAATFTLEWTPGLDQAGVYELEIVESTTGEKGRLKLGVADRWQSQGNLPIADPSGYSEEMGLPVLHLFHSAPLSRDRYGPATVVYRGHTYQAEAKVRGATSLSFPKKSYTLKFPDTDEFEDLSVGFSRRDKLVLITPFNDNSYLRHRLAFELWSRMDPTHIRLRTFSVVVFVNGQYWGLYTAADHVDSDLMKRHGLWKEGNLFKSINSDANFSLLARDGTPKDPLHQGFEKKSGLPEDGSEGAYDDLDGLTRFVASSSPEGFRSGLPTRVRQSEYEDWWILITLLVATDSGGKNAYHFHDPRGGLFRYLPWDLDAALGQSWNTTRTSPTARLTFYGYNEMFKRMMADPLMAGPIRARYRQLMQGPLSAQEVLSLLDRYAQEVRAAALRDEEKWSARYRTYSLWSGRTDFTSFEEELEYMRNWVRARWNSLEARPL